MTKPDDHRTVPPLGASITRSLRQHIFFDDQAPSSTPQSSSPNTREDLIRILEEAIKMVDEFEAEDADWNVQFSTKNKGDDKNHQ